MKKLRNLYFIAGLFALAFALLTKHIPGVTVTDFVQGFCYGLAVAMCLAGIVTSAIPYFYRNDKKKAAPAKDEAKGETHETRDPKTPIAGHGADSKTADATNHTGINTL